MELVVIMNIPDLMLLENYIKTDYNIVLCIVSVDKNIVIKREEIRFLETGRRVQPRYLRSI